MLPCEKIMRNCAWDMLLRCSQYSTTPCWDCSLGKEQAMSLMLDANSPIILIKPLPPWGLKGGTTLQQPCSVSCGAFPDNHFKRSIPAAILRACVNIAAIEAHGQWSSGSGS